MSKKSCLGLFLTLGMILACLAYPPTARSSPENAEKGKAAFETICSACHTIGGGVKVGPDLKGITNQRSQSWLTHFISDPSKMIKSGDPTANSLLKEFHGVQMPTLGLSSEQVADVLAYLRTTALPARAQAPPPKAPAPAAVPAAQTTAAPLAAAQAPGPPAAVLPTGSASTGEQLFTGAIPLQKGGPPCVSCHDVARLPFPGGGTLGPDLTGASGKFGAGMGAVLATLPFPTMKPIFGNRLLIPQEQQDLAAFLQKAGVQSLISRTVEIALAAVGGLIILIILAWIIWQNRLVPVRRGLMERAGKIGGAGR